MCLAVPLKVSRINGNEALGEAEGVSRRIRVDFIDNLREGDYVYVHAGFAIEKLDEKHALENLELIKEVTNALKSV